MSDPQVSQAHRQTGEIIPLIEGTPAPVALDEMRQMLGYIEEFVKSILKEKEDYAKVPGTDRNCLLQPGAEKIKFAFNLADEYTTLERYVEPDREWTYRTFDKRTQTEVERKARGYFRYEVRCDLVNRKTGVIWGACVGVCESSERGREAAPANTIIKMAQKRAMVGAAKSVAFLSGRFTCDLEDLQGDQAVHHADEDPVPDGCTSAMLSRGDKSGKLGFCWTCNRRHIEAGEKIVKDAAEGKWHSRKCWEKAHAPESPAPEPTEDVPAVDAKGRTVWDQARDGEQAYLALFDEAERPGVREELDEVRRTVLRAKVTNEPVGELDMAGAGSVKEYIGWLAQSIKAQKGA